MRRIDHLAAHYISRWATAALHGKGVDLMRLVKCRWCAIGNHCRGRKGSECGCWCMSPGATK